MGGVTGALSRDLLRMPSAALIAASFARLKFTMSNRRPSRCRMRHICGYVSSRTTCRTAPRRQSHHYADFVFAFGAGEAAQAVLVSTTKLRQAGFETI